MWQMALGLALGLGLGSRFWVWQGPWRSLADGAAREETARSSNCFEPKALEPLKTVAQSFETFEN